MCYKNFLLHCYLIFANLYKMRLNDKQRENLGKYFFDLSKIVAGVYVFTGLPDKPALFSIGLLSALIFLICGLLLVRGEAK